MKSDSFVSVVMIVDRNIIMLENAISGIYKELESKYTDYEIVLIGQGPVQDYGLNESLEFMLKKYPSIRYIQLSSRVNADIAWAAGIENAIGDFVVLFDHVTDPISVISEIVETSKSGYDVVVGVAHQSQTYSYHFFRKITDYALQAIDYHLPKNATSLRCLSRRTVNAVMRTGRFHHQLFLRIQKTGYPSCAHEYKQLSKNTLRKSLRSGFYRFIRLLVFNSSKPLRWVSGLGIFGSMAAFLFAVYSVLIHFFTGKVVEGWTTTILFIAMLFIIQFIMLAFFGEYLGRLLDDRSEQAEYSVVFEKNSAVMVNKDRVNVLDEPENNEVNFVQTGRNK